MSQQTLQGGGPGDEEHEDSVASGGAIYASAQNADSLLDEIDEVLESNAETFVRSFVQKGGQ